MKETFAPLGYKKQYVPLLLLGKIAQKQQWMKTASQTDIVPFQKWVKT
jgi:hypothetical protein